MKRNVLITAMVFAAGSLLAADPKDSVTAAAKKLVDGGNYSWKSTVDNGAGGGGFGGGGGGPQVSEGKVASGLIWTSAPGFGGFGGGGGGGGAPANTERLFKGTNSATKGQDGKWQTAEELAAAAAAAAADGGGGGGGGFGGGGRRGGRGFGGGTPTLPADGIAALVSATKDLTESGGVISGDLTEDGAKAQMQFGGRGGRGGRGGPGGGGGGGGFTPPEITGAKGSVKFWLMNGALSKYELKSAGAMSFNGNDITIDRTTTVEFKDAGNTKIDAPADIIAKISK